MHICWLARFIAAFLVISSFVFYQANKLQLRRVWWVWNFTCVSWKILHI